jgi:uncharacterized protein DUF983
MYVDKNPYHLLSVLTMHGHCGHCRLKYQIEPSFFFGAMYVSYGVNVALGIVAFLVSYVLLNMSLRTSFITIIAAIIVLYPLILRVSRNIYINMFVSYKGSATK